MILDDSHPVFDLPKIHQGVRRERRPRNPWPCAPRLRRDRGKGGGRERGKSGGWGPWSRGRHPGGGRGGGRLGGGGMGSEAALGLGLVTHEVGDGIVSGYRSRIETYLDEDGDWR